MMYREEFTRENKKFGRLILLLLISWTLNAAFATSTAASSVADTGAEPVEINFWDFPHLPETNQHVQRTIKRFQEENPGVTIRFTRIPWQDGQQKVMLSVNSGRPPDVCCQVNVSPQFIAQGVLEPLNEYLKDDLDDYHKAYIEAVTFKNDIYAVPWYKACYVMVLNLDLFDKFGVEPPRNGRWTWDEFLEKMKRLTSIEKDAASGSSKQYYGLITNLGPAEYEAYSIVYNAGGRILETRPDGRIVSGVTSPEFLEGIRRLADLDFRYKVCAPGIGAMTQEQSWNAWRDSRNCAVTIQGAWCITAVDMFNKSIQATNEKKIAAGRTSEVQKPIRWMIASPPSNDANTSPVLASSGLGTFVVFKQKDVRKRNLCVQFVKMLTNGEGQTVLKHENVYPSRISTGNLYQDSPQLGHVFELFPEGVANPLVPGIERLDRVLNQEIQKAVLRDPRTGGPQLSPEDAVRAADRKVKAILERAERRFGNM